MNYICTWLCLDKREEESYFPQTGRSSSSREHQDIYWRCVLVFFITSARFNKNYQHLLFTNTAAIPRVDGRNTTRILEKLGVTIIHTDFKYRTPRGYFFSFQNQFYEFSILEHIASHRPGKDNYLILDSDCVFLKPVDDLFAAASANGFISFEDDVLPDYVINGLSRNHLKEIYEELLGVQLETIPAYHLGEFFLASTDNIRQIFADFSKLWPILLERHAAGKKKFNEEAHTLSYLYFKNDLKAGQRDTFIKRVWTNPLFYRNVSPSDTALVIWHLPAEKTYGIRKLYDFLMQFPDEYGAHIEDENFAALLGEIMGIPSLSISRRGHYYVSSYIRALKKRYYKLPVVRRFITSG